MSKYEDLALQVVKHVGGLDNIESVTNCMTRLRFSLKNDKKADVAALENTDGVQGVVNKNGQFQVVIGTDVSNVCDEIKKMKNFDGTEKTSKKEGSIINRVIGAITAIFQPIIPAICGAGSSIQSCRYNCKYLSDVKYGCRYCILLPSSLLGSVRCKSIWMQPLSGSSDGSNAFTPDVQWFCKRRGGNHDLGTSNPSRKLRLTGCSANPDRMVYVLCGKICKEMDPKCSQRIHGSTGSVHGYGSGCILRIRSSWILRR